MYQWAQKWASAKIAGNEHTEPEVAAMLEAVTRVNPNSSFIKPLSNMQRTLLGKQDQEFEPGTWVRYVKPDNKFYGRVFYITGKSYAIFRGKLPKGTVDHYLDPLWLDPVTPGDQDIIDMTTRRLKK